MEREAGITCHVFCAAAFHGLWKPVEPGEPVVAADGGLRHVETLGLEPRVILGDFDSLGYVPPGENVRRHPVEKDDTDSMLTARLALDWGCRQVIFYGALEGPRLDHTIANFQTLTFLAERGVTGILVGRTQLVTALPPGRVTFPQTCQGTVSAFCLGKQVQELTIRNLQYELNRGSLTPGFPLGVSNHFQGRESTLQWQEGILHLVWDRSETGFPGDGFCYTPA